MTGVYTTYMSLAEAQHALGILEREHLMRLLLAHRRKHHRYAFPHEVIIDNKPLLSGALVRQMAECEGCYPALMVARLPRVRHYAEALVDEAFFEPEAGEPCPVNPLGEEESGD